MVCADEVETGVKADGAWTEQSGTVCAVLTADCLPVLLCDTKGTRVAAVHAGWRGLSDGVLDAALSQFIQDGYKPENLIAWLGPAIGAANYEVDQQVRKAFGASRAYDENAFRPARPGHWFLDICAAARAVLMSHGVQNISGGDLCTFSDERFYSYRHSKGCGRQATL